MLQPVLEMEKILKKENDLYNIIYDIEEKKSDVIINKDWANLEKLSLEQDELLLTIDKLETERGEQIEKYRQLNKLDDLRKDITLKEIILSMDEDSTHHLFELGSELKNTIINIGDVVKINDKLLNDNMEFYNIILSGMKSSTAIDSRYSEDGKENNNKAVDPVLFNQTA